MVILAERGGSMSGKMNEDIQLSEHSAAIEPVALEFDEVLDITKDVCPMTFVRTRLALDRLHSGAVLLVRLTGQEPVANVPRTAEAQGHHLLATVSGDDGVTRIWLRRK